MLKFMGKKLHVFTNFTLRILFNWTVLKDVFYAYAVPLSAVPLSDALAQISNSDYSMKAIKIKHEKMGCRSFYFYST